MHRSKIEWVLNPDNKTLGWVWNPLTGCLNHTPEGLCLGGMFPCYAYKLANGRLKPRYLANKNVAPYEEGYEDEIIARCDLALCSLDPFYPRFWTHRLAEPIEHPRHYDLIKKKGIFVCDMSDLFGIGIPEEWTEQVMFRIKLCPYHRFYLLTKQPQNLIKFSPFPENCYVGVSATNQMQSNGALQYLLNIKAKVKFISYEPLLEHISFYSGAFLNGKPYINWVILGAMTCSGGDLAKLSSLYPQLTRMPYGKRYTLQPKLEWVEEIVKAADKAGVKVFLKDNLKPLLPVRLPYYLKFLDDAGNTIWRLRQEVPE